MSMNILPVSLIREADAFTIANEPIAAIDLMERAAAACYGWIRENLPPGKRFLVFCGPGNNGGDGLAVARMLVRAGERVEVFTLAPESQMSESCRTNFLRMQECMNAGNSALPDRVGRPQAGRVADNEGSGKTVIRELQEGDELPVAGPDDIIIDAIFGNGLGRPPGGLSAAVIRHINGSGARVAAIDLPSGMYCDEATPRETGHPVVHATWTLTFSPPKFGLFFPENDELTGQWHLLDIGLDAEFTGRAEVKNFMLTVTDVAPLLRKRNKFDHKGRFGHALILAGSAGKMGAAVLASRACLRSGAGLTTVHVPSAGVPILHTAVPEAMLSIDPSETGLSEIPSLTRYTVVAAGPGLGTAPPAARALKILIQEANQPLVFDADAINILAENKTWLGFLRPGCIFTPHPKEFGRMAGKSANDFERNRLQREFSLRFQCFVVLKGAHTSITTPDGRCYFNTTGNPGMATGGSGDVLTGILAGLLACGYPAREACLLGVFLHGIAGDIASDNCGYEALIASDIINNLGNSFQFLYGKL